jgi:hypothetical protein
MASLTAIGTIKGTSSFRAVISASEILQVSKHTVSIISARSGFCNYFYYLPRSPRHFAINPRHPNRFLLVYPPSGPDAESLVVLDARSGSVIKQFNMKSQNQTFQQALLGTHIFFTVTSAPQILNFSQISKEHTLAQYEMPFAPAILAANATEARLLAVRGDNRAVIIGDLDGKNGPKVVKELPLPPFLPSCLTYSERRISIGTAKGEIIFIDTDAAQHKTITTPHSSAPVGFTESFGVTRDGIVFALETGEILSNVVNPIAVQAAGPTLVVFGQAKIRVFEATKRAVCSMSNIQPPEPFTSAVFSVPSLVLFASASSVYSFNVHSNAISKFAPGQEKIVKLVPSSGVVSIVYSTPDGDRIMTYVSGTKKRDEPGIDVACDHLGRHWILQKDSVIVFAQKHLLLDQVQRIELPEDHKVDRIFRLGSTIGLYSTAIGAASSLNAGQFVAFVAPANVCLIQWPAMCTREAIFICQNVGDDYQALSADDYTRVDASVNSCCWLAQTLFAVEDRKIIAIGSRDCKKRVIDSLPNAMCFIAAAFPSVLIFVTALPDLRVITVNQPFLSHVAIVDLQDSDLEALRYMLSQMPRLAIDPRAVSTLSPMFAMSVFSRSPPKFVNDQVITVYSRFGGFMELLNLVRQTRGSREVLKKVADAARLLGQFEHARQLYEELGEDEELFTLFVLSRHAHNLAILADRSGLARPIEAAFGVIAKAGNYEALPSLKLPATRSPHTMNEFMLYAGHPDDAAALYTPAFDELSNFGIREYTISDEETDSIGVQDQAFEVPVAASTSSSGLAPTPASPEAGAPPADGAEPAEAASEPPPKEVTAPPKLELSVGLDRFFTGDEDEPKKAIQIEIKTATVQLGAAGVRRRAATRRGGFALKALATQDLTPAPVPEHPPPADPPERPPPGEAPVDPFAEAPQAQDADQNPGDIGASQSSIYTSSLFF